MDELNIAVVLSYPFSSFLYSMPSSGIYWKFALNKYFIIIILDNFLLQSQLCVLTLILCRFHPCVTTVACKRPWSFCQKCRWQVTPKHAYTFDPTKSEWADYAAVQAEWRNLTGKELTRNSSGNTRSQSSQLAEPLWTDPGLTSGISVRELISNLKKKKRGNKKRRWEMNWRHCPQIPALEKKANTTTIIILLFKFLLREK